MSQTLPAAEGVAMMAKAPAEPIAFGELTVLLEPNDDVAIAKQPLLPGTQLLMADGSTFAYRKWFRRVTRSLSMMCRSMAG